MVQVCKKRVGISIMAVILMLGQCALAEIVRLEVEGLVDKVLATGPYGLDGSVQLGTAMTGYCIYDTEAPPLYEGRYPLLDISMSVGNYTFSHVLLSSYPPRFVVFTDGGYAAETINFSGMFEGIVIKDGNPIGWESQVWYGDLCVMDLLSSHEEYFPDMDLPTAESFPPFWVFDARAEFRVGFSDVSAYGFAISGHLTDIRAVPEPASVLLLAFGVPLLRRKK